MNTAKASPPKFRLGDWVTFKYGVRPVFAQIIEDRGPLGVGRRRLYRIRLAREFDESPSFEMPEDEMEKVVPDKVAVMQYLKQGGLKKILLANTQGGPIQNQPKVWLTYDPRGEISHTFEAELGLVGAGATVPFLGSLDRRYRERVILLLQSFGLTEDEAKEVMDAEGLQIP